MPSILIHGGSPQTRQEKALTFLQDHYLHSIEEEGKILPVPRVRELLPHLHLQPPPPWKGRGLLILEAQRMNEEVQNTLLKILEEPPGSLTFVLTVPHPRLLLPTIVSRCLIETATINGGKFKNQQLVQEILAATFGQRLSIFEEKVGYNRAAAVAFLEEVELELSEHPTPILKEIWETKKLLRDDTTNVKVVVDRFLLSW